MQGTKKSTTKGAKKGTTKTSGIPRFSVDWFSNNIATWQRYVVPHLLDKPATALELGCYEGRSARWLLENALSHPSSKLVCIDDWKNVTPATKEKKMSNTYKTFRHNVELPFLDKVTVVRGRLEDELRSTECAVKDGTVDFAYVDTTLGGGTSRDILEAAVLVFPKLKPGGMLVFDDYTHSKHHDASCPRQGIDAFLNCYASQIKIIHSGWQVILIRRRKPLPVCGCMSEYYHEDVEEV